jgi:CheY-like chemotaxis protein
MKKILIIDDSPFYVKMIGEVLPKGKYNIQIASNGLEGLEQIKKDKPDLIVLDLMMPELDGISFLKKIQAESGTLPIPVLIFSNMSEIDKISEGIALGVKGYVVKSQESLASIAEHIERMFEKEA